MTKLKRIAATIVVAASIGSIELVSYAEQVTPSEYCTLDWGAGNARNDLNEIDEEIVWDEQMLAAINSKNEQISAMKKSRLTYPSAYEVDVTWQQQINDYYCGPATASTILSIMNCTTPTQTQIASSQYLRTTTAGTPWYSGGADPTASPTYYNMSYALDLWQYHQNGRYEWSYTVYPYNTTPSDSEYIDNIKFTIYMDHLVAINGLSSEDADDLSHMPGYPTSDVGHWLVCNGWTADNEYWIVDPAAGISGFRNVEQKYKVPEDKLLAFIHHGIVY